VTARSRLFSGPFSKRGFEQIVPNFFFKKCKKEKGKPTPAFLVVTMTSAAYHLFPKHDHADEMFRGRPNHIKPALETSDTVH
jgi:hypothetical protein